MQIGDNMAFLIGLLKIIGIILAIILVLIAIIIFSNIKLKVDFTNRDKTKYVVKVTYILGLITYILDNENNINCLKILGINLEKFKKNKRVTKNKNIEDNEIVYQTASINSPKDDNTHKKENIKNEKTKKSKNTKNTKNTEHTQNRQNKENTKCDEEKQKKSILQKISNIKQKIKKINRKIKKFIHYPRKKEVINLVLKLLKRLLNAIKFKKIKINIDYGLDEPFKTGQICGIISSIIPFLPKKLTKDIKILPDFENIIFLADIQIKCSTSLFKLLFPIVIFITKKDIRKIIFSKGE